MYICMYVCIYIYACARARARNEGEYISLAPLLSVELVNHVHNFFNCSNYRISCTSFTV